MGSKPRGFALIININKFVNNCEPERVGSEYDVQQLCNLLRQLDYDIVLRPDLTKKVSI